MNFMNVDYSTKIPNNVNLSEDRQVLKALEGWHPGYIAIRERVHAGTTKPLLLPSPEGTQRRSLGLHRREP